MICKGCGEEIRRIYSIASDGEDDYLSACGCPTDWAEVLMQITICSLIIGALLLAVWSKS